MVDLEIRVEDTSAEALISKMFPSFIILINNFLTKVRLLIKDIFQTHLFKFSLNHRRKRMSSLIEDIGLDMKFFACSFLNFY